MNYKHTFHAGNIADVFKHWALYTIILYMQQKDKGIRFIDTHAGFGAYTLDPTGEALDGILRIWPHREKTTGSLRAFLEHIASFQTEKLTAYPGSPLVFARLIRPQDHLLVYETEQEAFAALRNHLRHTATLGKVHAHKDNGYPALESMLPSSTGRACILVDPPFESRTEWTDLKQALKTIAKRMPHAVTCIWYPIKARLEVQHFLEEAERHFPGKCKTLTWSKNEAVTGRLESAGLLILNPPFGFEGAVNELQHQWHTLGFPNLQVHY